MKILILEHDSNDIELLQYELRRSGLDYTAHLVHTRESYIEALQTFGPDIILSDYSLPSFDGLSAFRIRQELAPDVPFIIVSGTIGDENAVELIKGGITDYVLKEKIYQVSLKIKRALAEVEERNQRNLAKQQLLLQEAELRSHHELVTNILSSISDGFFAINAERVVTYWNQMAEKLLGVPKEHIIGRNFWDVFKGVVPVNFTEAYQKVVAGETTIYFEDYLAFNDSWFELTLSSSGDGVVVYFRDITDKKRKEKLDMLEKKTLELYTLHTYSMADAITFLLNGVKALFPALSFVLSRIEDDKLYNWISPHIPLAGPASVAGAPIHTTPIPCARAASLKHELVIEDVKNVPEWKHYADFMASQHIHTVASYPFFDVNQKPIGVLAVFLNAQRAIRPDEEQAIGKLISILRHLVVSKLAEEALIKSEEKYRNLFHTSPTPMWVFNMETLQFMDVNTAAVRHYGYSKEEFLQMTLLDIRPEDDVPEFLEILNQLNATGILPNTLVRHKTKDGRIIYVNIQSNSIKLNGQDARIVLATDFTENLQHIQAIERQNIQLREIAWMQSHVVRAPVARILGLSGMLEREAENPTKCREIISYVKRSTHELDNVIREIVKKADKLEEYSKVERQYNV